MEAAPRSRPTAAPTPPRRHCAPMASTTSEPAPDSATGDTSGVLRAKLATFASTTDSPSYVPSASTSSDADEDLHFGTPPSRIDYAATNAQPTTECMKVYADDLLVKGATGAFWTDGQQLVGINAVEFGADVQAKQYYWATTCSSATATRTATAGRRTGSP